MDGRVRAPSGLIVLLSLWLIVSPWVLSFAGSTGMWIAVVTGAAALILAWACYDSETMPSLFSWLVVLLGVWLIAAPFLFGMAGVTRLLWDYVIVGVGYILFGTMSARVLPYPVDRFPTDRV